MGHIDESQLSETELAQRRAKEERREKIRGAREWPSRRGPWQDHSQRKVEEQADGEDNG